MTQEAEPKPGSLAVVPAGQTPVAFRAADALLVFTPEQKQLIKNTIAQGATDNELALFMHWAQTNGFDPLRGQCYFAKMKDEHSGKDVAKFFPGIDGLRSRAAGFPDFLGMQSSAVCSKDIFKFDAGKGEVVSHEFGADRGNVVGAWAKILRKDKPSVCVYVRYDEFVQARYNWRKSPAAMIEKVAQAQCVRKAYPDRFSGVYAAEELGMVITPQGAMPDREMAAVAEITAPVPGQAPQGVVAQATAQAGVVEDARRKELNSEILTIKVRGWSGAVIKAWAEHLTGRPVSGTSDLPTEELAQLVAILKEKKPGEMPPVKQEETAVSEPPIMPQEGPQEAAGGGVGSAAVPSDSPPAPAQPASPDQGKPEPQESPLPPDPGDPMTSEQAVVMVQLTDQVGFGTFVKIKAKVNAHKDYTKFTRQETGQLIQLMEVAAMEDLPGYDSGGKEISWLKCPDCGRFVFDRDGGPDVGPVRTNQDGSEHETNCKAKVREAKTKARKK